MSPHITMCKKRFICRELFRILCRLCFCFYDKSFSLGHVLAITARATLQGVLLTSHTLDVVQISVFFSVLISDSRLAMASDCNFCRCKVTTSDTRKT